MLKSANLPHKRDLDDSQSHVTVAWYFARHIKSAMRGFGIPLFLVRFVKWEMIQLKSCLMYSLFIQRHKISSCGSSGSLGSCSSSPRGKKEGVFEVEQNWMQSFKKVA